MNLKTDEVLYCEECGDDYTLCYRNPSRGEAQWKSGPRNLCWECTKEWNHKNWNRNPVRKSGNMIYDHKTAPELQINDDPRVTNYIRASTRASTFNAYLHLGSYKTPDEVGNDTKEK